MEDRKIELDELAKQHNIEFILLYKYNLQEYENKKDDPKVVFVTEEELLDGMTDDEFAEYKVSVSDVVNAFYIQTIKMIVKKGYKIEDERVFKEDFMYFFYYLSDNDTEKLLKTALL
jgi:hypothetical protein